MDHAGTVVTVEPHVMKKLSGLDTVATVKAVAEVEVQPQVCLGVFTTAPERTVMHDRILVVPFSDPVNAPTSCFTTAIIINSTLSCADILVPKTLGLA